MLSLHLLLVGQCTWALERRQIAFISPICLFDVHLLSPQVFLVLGCYSKKLAEQ